MSFYLDTSFAVAAFTAEEKTYLAQDWIGQHADQELYISDWTRTEFSSALSIKIRTEALSIANRAKVLADWHMFETGSLGHIGVISEDFLTATRFADRYDLSLRASDALHLAVAYRAGLSLVTFDKRMREAALNLGVQAVEFTP